ncbi:hypothetical protein B0533_12145 [Sedimentibacter sp. SX930]|nr:hypothetical protein B0533_12145 [Sedimentibacter sp. SX930]
MIDPLLVFATIFDADIKFAIVSLFLYYPSMSCNDIVRMTGEKKVKCHHQSVATANGYDCGQSD